MTGYKVSIYEPHAIMVHGMTVRASLSDGRGFMAIKAARWVELLQARTIAGQAWWIVKPIEVADSAEPYTVRQGQLYESLSEFEKNGELTA